MLHKLKQALIILSFVLGSSLLLAPAVVHADFKDDACQGVNALNGSTSPACSTGAETALNRILRFIIQIFSIVVGFIAVVMVIVGGLKYITANGDSGALASARNTIIYALIGVIVVALAQILVHFVIFKTNGALNPKP